MKDKLVKISKLDKNAEKLYMWRVPVWCAEGHRVRAQRNHPQSTFIVEPMPR